MNDYTIFFDLETGGVEPSHPTIQLGAIAVDASGAEVAAFETKIAFDVAKAAPKALELNHCAAEAWKGAVTPTQAAGKFSAFVKPYSSIEMISKRTGQPYNVAKLAGYNAITFDLPRLKALYAEQFFPCAYLVRDVLQRALFYFDEHPTIAKPENMKLGTVCAYFGITNGTHDALADARLSAKLCACFCKHDSKEVAW